MCGRFTNLLTWRELVGFYRITDPRPAPNWPAHNPVAPATFLKVD